MEMSSCTEDRIKHALDRCLFGLGCDSPDKQLFNAGLCLNRWCLEELVKRDAHNFLILLQQILRKTREVLEQCQYEQVVPLTLLFSSTLMKAPYLSPDCGLLQEAYLLFHNFLSWPIPYSSAAKRLLLIISQELRAPGISFLRLVREEQGLATDNKCPKMITVLLLSPDEDVPPEFRSVSEQLSRMSHSQKDITVSLIKHAFQAVHGPKHPLHTLHSTLQSKSSEELEQLLSAITDTLESAASTAVPDSQITRDSLFHSMDRLMEGLLDPSTTNGSSHPGDVATLALPFARCHVSSWGKDNFDDLSDILASELPDCFELDEDDHNKPNDEEEVEGRKAEGEHENHEDNHNELNNDEEAEGRKVEGELLNHRVSTVSSRDSTLSRDSMFSRDSMLSNYSLSSSWSVPSARQSESSGVDSDFGDDTEETCDGVRHRRKPKKKSRSLLNTDRFSQLFKNHRSPAICRRAVSMGYGDPGKVGAECKRSMSLQRNLQRTPSRPFAPSPPTDCLSPQKHVCVRRRPILSCDEGGGVVEVSTLLRVVVFGGTREAGRLARAYSDLQQKELRCRRLTKMCRLQFYFLPAKRKGPGGGKESNGVSQESNTTDLAQLVGRIDSWYDRNVFGLLSLSSDVLCQTTCKVDEDSLGSSSSAESLPLLADLLLYYCRNAHQPVLMQLYQAELTLAGGEKRKEVFIHSLELGHTAGTRAVMAMGAASKRFGIVGDRDAVPLKLHVSYNKVAVSGRGERMETDVVCTSINLYNGCLKPEQPDSRMNSLQLTITQVLKRQSSRAKMSYNQHLHVSEVKVDDVQVSGGGEGMTFAVCLDQDEKKIIQSVTRCEVSLCSKPGSSSDWRSYKFLPGQIHPLHPSYRSLLCLPITSFSASYP